MASNAVIVVITGAPGSGKQLLPSIWHNALIWVCISQLMNCVHGWCRVGLSRFQFWLRLRSSNCGLLARSLVRRQACTRNMDIAWLLMMCLRRLIYKRCLPKLIRASCIKSCFVQCLNEWLNETMNVIANLISKNGNLWSRTSIRTYAATIRLIRDGLCLIPVTWMSRRPSMRSFIQSVPADAKAWSAILWRESSDRTSLFNEF